MLSIMVKYPPVSQLFFAPYVLLYTLTHTYTQRISPFLAFETPSSMQAFWLNPLLDGSRAVESNTVDFERI
jgi:hypothetical protein